MNRKCSGKREKQGAALSCKAFIVTAGDKNTE